MMNTLVTGASGFIGANLCYRLLKEGHAVHALVRPGSDLWRITDIIDEIHVHEIDINDNESIFSRIEKIQPDVIYHMATHGAYPFQTEPDLIMLTNVFGLWNLLNACKNIDYKLFVNVGSSSEYGLKKHAMRETDLLEPNSYYAVAKAGQTLLSQHVARTTNKPIVTVRPFSVYGPLEEPSRFIPKLMLAAINKTKIDMVSPKTCRDFIYIDDIIDLLMDISAIRNHPGEVFNIGTGVQTTLKTMIDVLSEVSETEIDARWGEMEARMWDAQTWVADITKAHRLLDWSPKYTVEKGLKKCLEWFRNNLDKYQD